jgi:prepilin-type N-terminal cleavage/methylation domain-containing protein
MKYLGEESGFTLVELIVTATLVAIFVVAVIQMFISIDNINRQSRNLALATQLAQRHMESYRNTGYASIPVSPVDDFTSQMPSNLASPRSATATITEVNDGLKRVDIAIYYNEGSKRKNVNISTLIAAQGIDK